MKFRKELGSEAVRDLIREAEERAATLRERLAPEPWPNDRALVVPSLAAEPGTPAKPTRE